MKQFLSFFFAALMLATTSCSKNDDDGDNAAAVATSLQSGTWRISSFVQNGDALTDFDSFVFNFGSSGTVTATNSILTATGTWSTAVDNSKAKLNLDFNSGALFDEISEDWEIMGQSSIQVSLRHISGGNGETDLLVFQKN